MSYITSTQTLSFARKPHPKEEVCGDDGAAWDDPDHTWLVISDGLGHGAGAAKATEAALSWITANYSNNLEATVRGCDKAIRHTRGVSLNIARINRSTKATDYVSVGANLGWKVQRSGIQRFAGDSGVVGSGVRNLKTTRVDLDGAGYLVLASDGLNTTSDVSALYHSTFDGDVSLAEACLERWTTGKDDSSIFVYRFT
ncbi:SpoIIE family protein phosphatase [Candidatus Lucifugimonas marina]|uniref:SpoIIE family protein phosphatase n=1 Tax=Candidatus Lucifugimonas marina TaxID=3038979 RepID=UPI00319E0C9C